MEIPRPKDPANIAILSKHLRANFKIMFDYSMENNYKFSDIDRVNSPYDNGRALTNKEKFKLYRALGSFIEEATSMTYTEVGKIYGRKQDVTDLKLDIENPDEDQQVYHYKIAKTGIGKIARIHGCIVRGVFVVKRIDWTHNYHKKTRKPSANAS